VGGLRRCLVNFFAGVLAGKFGVKKSVSNIFLLSSVYGSILVGTGNVTSGGL